MSRHRESDGFAHSMTDLMAGVAVTFLILAAIFMVQAANARVQSKKDEEKRSLEARQAKQKLDQLSSLDKSAEDALINLRKKLTDQEQSMAAPDPSDPFLLVVKFDTNSLFNAGSCTLTEDAKKNIAAKVYSAFTAVCDASVRPFLHSIVLEGHTDSTPFTNLDRRCGALDGCKNTTCEEEGFRNNVRLSAARAQAVFFEARDIVPVSDHSLVTECLDKYFAVVGRGPVEPADGSPWRANRGARPDDRRVVLKVRVRTHSALTYDAGAP